MSLLICPEKSGEQMRNKIRYLNCYKILILCILITVIFSVELNTSAYAGVYGNINYIYPLTLMEPSFQKIGLFSPSKHPGSYLLFQATSMINRHFKVRKLIKASEGGTLVAGSSDNIGQCKIFLKPDDLSEDTIIRLEWKLWENQEKIINSVKFEPHGILFNKPVKIELSYKFADFNEFQEDHLKVYYFNEEKNKWGSIGGFVDKKRKVVVAYVRHFSRYAIGEVP